MVNDNSITSPEMLTPLALNRASDLTADHLDVKSGFEIDDLEGSGMIASVTSDINLDSGSNNLTNLSPDSKITASSIQSYSVPSFGLEGLMEYTSSLYVDPNTQNVDSQHGGVKITSKTKPLGGEESSLDLFLGFKGYLGDLSIENPTNSSSFNVTVGDDTNTLLKLSKDDNFVEITPTQITAPKFIKTGGTANEILMADGSVKEVSNLLTDTKVISLNNESEEYGGSVANITLDVEDAFTPNLCVSMNRPSHSTDSVKMYLGYNDNISDEELSIGIVANGKASNGIDDECRAAGILADMFTGFKAYTGSREAMISVSDDYSDSYILLQSTKEEDLVMEQFPGLRHWEDPKGIYIRCRIPEGEGLAEKYGESHIKCPRFITTGGTSDQVVLGDGTLKPLSEIGGSGSSTGGLELGTTETTAFRGDLGQAVYDAIFTINKPVCPNIIKVSDLVIKNYNGEVLENESLSVSNNETSGASITIENGIKLDFSLEYKWVSSDDYKNPKAIDLTAEDGITLPWTTLVNTSNTYSNKVSYSNVSSGKTYKAKTSAPKVGLMVEGSTVKPASGNDFGSGEFKVNITRRRFFGLISNGSEITSSLITGLESELSTGRAKSVTITVPGDKQYVYAFESSLGTPAITNKDGESQADFWPVKKITITNSYGKAIEYSCYVCGAGSYTNSLVNFK
jgi:hypothetical protein